MVPGPPFQPWSVSGGGPIHPHAQVWSGGPGVRAPSIRQHPVADLGDGAGGPTDKGQDPVLTSGSWIVAMRGQGCCRAAL